MIAAMQFGAVIGAVLFGWGIAVTAAIVGAERRR